MALDPAWVDALVPETRTAVGRFALRPVGDSDLRLVAGWMNDPDVAEFWELAGPVERTRAHIARQRETGHAACLVGLLDGEPMSYWEVYRADLDPLARHYPAVAHDAGLHLLIGRSPDRGRGRGTALIREVAERLLAADDRITRVVAEPDVRNARSVRAFQRAGFDRRENLDLPDKRAALMARDRATARAAEPRDTREPRDARTNNNEDGPYDLIGVGIGPFNLALAALADAVPDLHAVFVDAKPEFRWHPGLLFSDAVLQVPFLADLVTLIDPTSRWSFLNYLRAHERLFPFYFAERFHVPRREYDHYARWVASQLPSCRFHTTVEAVCWDAEAELFRVSVRTTRDRTGHGRVSQLTARNVVLGVGTEPVVPEPFAGLPAERVFHVAEYLDRRPSLVDRREVRDVTVVGSGQSGAEAFLDLLRAQPEQGWRLRWLSRSPAFAPMEYSKLGLEHFTPEYTRYFHQLPAETRDRLLPRQWQLYKGISADTIASIHDLLYERGVGGDWPDVTLMPNVAVTAARLTDPASSDPTGTAPADADVASTHTEAIEAPIELDCQHVEQDRSFAVRSDAVVLATGYAARRPALLEPLGPLIDADATGRYRVDERYRVALHPSVTGGLYVQNAEAHTHGVGAPDLGLGAYRAAVIVNAVTGRACYRLPARTAFTTFGASTASPASTAPVREENRVATRAR